MLCFSAILLAFCASAAFGTEDSTLWIDDKSQENLYNCDGFVTDAICCQDRICQGQSESSCTSDDKRKLFCAWDSSKSKCLEVRDAKNNVCCQKKPLEGCNDLMKGRCPEQYQVSKECCSDDGKKWNSIFTGVSPGKVCCNAPCKDADFLKCGQLGRCNQRSYSPYLNPYDYGFGYHTQKKFPIGNLYPSLYSTIDNKEQFENYKTNEVTVDDIISMMVEALENDEDIVESDKSLHASPYGRQDYYNSWPVMRNYIDPNLIIRKLISPYGLTGYQGYGGYGHSHGGYGHGGYGHGYGGYGQGHGGYGQGHGGYGHGHGAYGHDSGHADENNEQGEESFSEKDDQGYGDHGYQKGPGYGYGGHRYGHDGPGYGYGGPGFGHGGYRHVHSGYGHGHGYGGYITGHSHGH